MHISSALLLAALPTALTQATYTRSSKRGLVFIPSDTHPYDDEIWVESGSDLTWYYNYGPQPSPAYYNLTQEEFEFVPQLWTSSSTFLSTVTSMISGGRNISHVLTFNEPDGSTATGGSNLAPSAAASAWISQVQPLKKLGVKLGAPAVTGSPSGFTWLQQFFDACASQGTNCTADFIPVHWYGNFQGLADHLGQVYGTYVSLFLPLLLSPPSQFSSPSMPSLHLNLHLTLLSPQLPQPNNLDNRIRRQQRHPHQHPILLQLLRLLLRPSLLRRTLLLLRLLPLRRLERRSQRGDVNERWETDGYRELVSWGRGDE
jgi:hypothetical protein